MATNKSEAFIYDIGFNSLFNYTLSSFTYLIINVFASHYTVQHTS